MTTRPLARCTRTGAGIAIARDLVITMALRVFDARLVRLKSSIMRERRRRVVEVAPLPSAMQLMKETPLHARLLPESNERIIRNQHARA